MYMYALTLVPLINRLQREFPTLLHLWYANDGNAAGSFVELKRHFDHLTRLGIPYGYFVQPNKSKLVTCHPDHACTFFVLHKLASLTSPLAGDFLADILVLSPILSHGSELTLIPGPTIFFL